MGEIADMMLDGTLCEGCGEFLGADGGFPQRCAACSRDSSASSAIDAVIGTKVPCPTCKRHVKPTGLKDHMRDKHGVQLS
jgi:hypothetical protein